MLDDLKKLARYPGLTCEIHLDPALPAVLVVNGQLAPRGTAWVFIGEADGLAIEIARPGVAWHVELEDDGGLTISKDPGKPTKFVRLRPRR